MTSLPTAVAQPEARDLLDDVPGNPMMWLLILSELAVFGLFFVGFAVARAVDPATFADSQAQLDRLIGGINTLVLVSSGALVALAVDAAARGRGRRVRPLMGAAMLLGLVFVALKLVEYAAKAEAGIGLETNTFFTLYYLMTGFHFLHVVMGLIVLAAVTWRNSLENLETGAAFWHMVDLLWVIMFPLVYLLR